jgi:putative tRNA adenosine deaminase-associated protein
VTYFATAIVRTSEGWSGQEVDLDEVEDLDGVTDLLRDLLDDTRGPALLMLEENDEYFLLVRLDGADTDEPRSFISDVRSVETSDLAAKLYDETGEQVVDLDDDDDESSARPEGEPGGDDGIVADLGTKPAALRELCAEEGLLPADAIYTICERAGCVDVLEELRGA